MLLLSVGILSACNQNAAEVIEKGKVIINEDTQQITFFAEMTDENLEPKTTFQARFFLQDETMRNAVGTDLVFTDKEFKVKDAKEGTVEVKKTMTLQEGSDLEKIIKEIKNKDEEVVTLEVINNDGLLDDLVVHKVEKE
jgi:hypothetical protein